MSKNKKPVKIALKGAKSTAPAATETESTTNVSSAPDSLSDSDDELIEGWLLLQDKLIGDSTSSAAAPTTTTAKRVPPTAKEQLAAKKSASSKPATTTTTTTAAASKPSTASSSSSSSTAPAPASTKTKVATADASSGSKRIRSSDDVNLEPLSQSDIVSAGSWKKQKTAPKPSSGKEAKKSAATTIGDDADPFATESDNDTEMPQQKAKAKDKESKRNTRAATAVAAEAENETAAATLAANNETVAADDDVSMAAEDTIVEFTQKEDPNESAEQEAARKIANGSAPSSPRKSSATPASAFSSPTRPRTPVKTKLALTPVVSASPARSAAASPARTAPINALDGSLVAIEEQQQQQQKQTAIVFNAEPEPDEWETVLLDKFVPTHAKSNNSSSNSKSTSSSSSSSSVDSTAAVASASRLFAERAPVASSFSAQQLKDELDKLRDELESKHAKKFEDEQQEHRKYLRIASEQHQQELSNKTTKLAAQLESKAQEELQAAVENHKREMQAQADLAASALANAKLEADNIKAQAQLEMQTLKSEHAAVVLGLRSEMSSREKMTENLKQQLEQQIQTLQQSLQEAKNAAESSSSATDALEQAKVQAQNQDSTIKKLLSALERLKTQGIMQASIDNCYYSLGPVIRALAFPETDVGRNASPNTQHAQMQKLIQTVMWLFSEKDIADINQAIQMQQLEREKKNADADGDAKLSPYNHFEFFTKIAWADFVKGRVPSLDNFVRNMLQMENSAKDPATNAKARSALIGLLRIVGRG